MSTRRPIDSITVSADATRATVHTRVDQFYREFLDEIDTSVKTEDQAFEAHLKIIIWGVMYLEGLANYKLYRLTERLLARKAALFGHYWGLMKQAKLEDKIALVFASDGVRRPSLQTNLKKLSQLVELRNRLVHFKDSPTEFEFAELRSKLKVNAPLAEWFDHVPNPKIVKDLLATTPEERKSLLQQVGDRLEGVHVC